MNPEKTSAPLLQRKRTSDINEHLIYLHPEVNKKEQELVACYYALENIWQRLSALLPTLSVSSLREGSKKEIAVSYDLFEVSQIRERVQKLLEELLNEDSQKFLHYSSHFLRQGFEINVGMKLQLYHKAGVRVRDFCYNKVERKSAGVRAIPDENSELTCAVSGITDSEEKFDVHHLFRKSLLGTSHHALLMQLHKKFHYFIHWLTNADDLKIQLEPLLNSLEKRTAISDRNVEASKKQVLLPAANKEMLKKMREEKKFDKISVREKLLILEKKYPEIHEYYISQLFTLNPSVALSHSDTEEQIITFLETYKDTIVDMRNKFAMLAISEMHDAIPVYVEEARRMHLAVCDYEAQKNLISAGDVLDRISDLLCRAPWDKIHIRKRKRHMNVIPSLKSSMQEETRKNDLYKKLESTLLSARASVKLLFRDDTTPFDIGFGTHPHNSDYSLKMGNIDEKRMLFTNYHEQLSLCLDILDALEIPDVDEKLIQNLLIQEDHVRELLKEMAHVKKIKYQDNIIAVTM